MTTKLSLEFELLASCCRWPPSIDAVEVFSRREIDWTQFLRLVDRHRVVGLVDHALRESWAWVPAHVRDELRQHARASALLSLRQAGEAHRLNKIMQRLEIAPIFIKGCTLGMLAYGSLGIKSAYDIDILVPAHQVGLAFQALREAGYLPASCPSLDDDTLTRKTAGAKDTGWHHTEYPFVVELHTRLFSNKALFPDIPREPTQDVSLAPGVSLPTLGQSDLLIYLGLHGAVHGWSRLKWLADFNALLRSTSSDVAALLQQAEEQGVHRAVGQAALLTSKLLGAPLPQTAQAAIAHSPFARIGANISLSMMAKHGARELDEFALGTFKIHLAHFFMRPGYRYKFAELTAKAAQMEIESGESRRTGSSFLLALLRWMKRRWKTRQQLRHSPAEHLTR